MIKKNKYKEKKQLRQKTIKILIKSQRKKFNKKYLIQNQINKRNQQREKNNYKKKIMIIKN